LIKSKRKKTEKKPSKQRTIEDYDLSKCCKTYLSNGPYNDNSWNQIENLQVLYGAAAPEMFSDLKSSWQQIFEIKKKLEEFAHDVPFGVV